MAKDIDNMVQACSVRNSLKAHQQKEPLHPTPVPELPWTTVATDIFEWNGHHYLVLLILLRMV